MKTYGDIALIVVSDLGANSKPLNRLYQDVINAIPADTFTGICRYFNPLEVATSPTWDQAGAKGLKIYADAIGTAYNAIPKNPKMGSYPAYIRALRAKGVEYFFMDDVNDELGDSTLLEKMTYPIQELGGIVVWSTAEKFRVKVTQEAMRVHAQTSYQFYRQDAGDGVEPIKKWLEELNFTWIDMECFNDGDDMTTMKAFNAMINLYITHPKRPKVYRLYAVDENTPLHKLAIWPEVCAGIKKLRVSLK